MRQRMAVHSFLLAYTCAELLARLALYSAAMEAFGLFLLLDTDSDP